MESSHFHPKNADYVQRWFPPTSHRENYCAVEFHNIVGENHYIHHLKEDTSIFQFLIQPEFLHLPKNKGTTQPGGKQHHHDYMNGVWCIKQVHLQIHTRVRNYNHMNEWIDDGRVEDDDVDVDDVPSLSPRFLSWMVWRSMEVARQQGSAVMHGDGSDIGGRPSLL
jgi:hypothetical protein